MLTAGLRRELRRRPTWIALAALCVAGCGYTSEYTPPQDGRARALWQDSDVVSSLPSIGAACAQAMQSPPPCCSSGGYGGPIVIVAPHPRPWIPPRPGLVHVGAPPAHVVSTGAHPGGGGSGVHLGGGGGGDAGKALGYLAILILLVLPAIDVTLAFAPSESPSKSSRAIDDVNRWNDQARGAGPACAPAPVGDDEVEE